MHGVFTIAVSTIAGYTIAGYTIPIGLKSRFESIDPDETGNFGEKTS